MLLLPVLSHYTRGLIFARFAVRLQVKSTWNTNVVTKRWTPESSFVPSFDICFRMFPPRLENHTSLFSHLFTPTEDSSLICEKGWTPGACGPGHTSILSKFSTQILGPHRYQALVPSYFLGASLPTRQLCRRRGYFTPMLWAKTQFPEKQRIAQPLIRLPPRDTHTHLFVQIMCTPTP